MTKFKKKKKLLLLVLELRFCGKNTPKMLELECALNVNWTDLTSVSEPLSSDNHVSQSKVLFCSLRTVSCFCIYCVTVAQMYCVLGMSDAP